MLDFRIETFVVVCKHMNYTRAAEQLHITQPTVSLHIHYLEHYYDVKLFTFSGKKMTLTEAGEQLLQASLTLQHDEWELINRLHKEKRHSLRIGATMSVAEGILSDKIPSFMDKNHDKDIQMVIGNTEYLLKKINAGELHVAFIEGKFRNDEFDSLSYQVEPFIAITHHPLPYKEQGYDIHELLSYPLLLREQGSGTRHLLEILLQEHNVEIDDFENFIEISSIHLIKETIKRGYGLTFLYQTVVEEELAKKEVVRIPLKGSTFFHNISFVWKKGSIFADSYKQIFYDFH